MAYAILHVAGNNERRIERAIQQRAKIETVCPLFKNQVIVRHKPQVRISMLWPCYVLVKHSENINIHTFAQINGIYAILRSSPEKPSLLSDEFVSAVLARCDREGVFIPLDEPAPDKITLHKGDKVQFVRDSPFANLRGIVAETTAADRVKIMFDLLGTNRSIQVDRDQLEIIS